jgi:polar amino acid transport system substrate-binding protein
VIIVSAATTNHKHLNQWNQVLPKNIRAELAPTGALRAAINLGNSLLVTGKSPTGAPEGVAPDLAREIALYLDVPVIYVPYERSGALADAVNEGVWDIGLIGAEPARAETIEFTAAYAEIEATYLVSKNSQLTNIDDVDQTGIRISVSERSAFDLWLQANIKNATLIPAANVDASFERFVEHNMEALAGLRPRLLSDVEKLIGSRILEGSFMTVQQAVGTKKSTKAGAAFLRDFVEEAKASGLISRLIGRHKVRGLSLAPAVE